MTGSWSKAQEDGTYAVWVKAKTERELVKLRGGEKIKVTSKAGKESEVVLNEQIKDPIEKEGEWIALWSIEKKN